MKDRPSLELLGHDGNIFAVMGSAGRLLRRAGLHEEADEMFERVQSCHDYYEALSIVSQYVDTELSSGGKGFIEADDITVDRELIPDKHGVDAYIETHFDLRERFGIRLDGDDYAELYATYVPATGELKSTFAVKCTDQEKDHYLEAQLYPCEKKMLITQMNDTCVRENGKGLKDFYDDWQRDYGNDQKNKKPKENHPAR